MKYAMERIEAAIAEFNETAQRGIKAGTMQPTRVVWGGPDKEETRWIRMMGQRAGLLDHREDNFEVSLIPSGDEASALDLCRFDLYFPESREFFLFPLESKKIARLFASIAPHSPPTTPTIVSEWNDDETERAEPYIIGVGAAIPIEVISGRNLDWILFELQSARDQVLNAMQNDQQD